MKDAKKKIFGASTSKKLAALLSASTLVLPLTSCNEQVQVQDATPLNVEKNSITLCDTSNITVDNFIKEYVESYENGDNSYILQQLEEYKKIYSMLREDPPAREPETQNEFDEIMFGPLSKIPETYNFDGTTIAYNELNNGDYIVDGEVVKSVGRNTVAIKTTKGEIDISNNNGTYLVENTTGENLVKVLMEFKPDESCTISEQEGKKSKNYDFNSDGMLVSSVFVDKQGSVTKNEYKNGNINVYDSFNKFDLIQETKNEDGSYVVYSYGFDKDRYQFDPPCKNCDVARYYYDKENNLEQVSVEYDRTKNDDSHEVYEAVLLPNGDSYEYVQQIDKDGNVVETSKIENIYKQTRTVLREGIDEDGNKDTSVYKYDYTLISPYTILNGENVKGDIVYQSYNGNVVIKEVDGIIYHYGQDGEFYNAYQTSEDGITYYRENQTKSKFIDKDLTETNYNEEGKVTSIKKDDVYTSYYDYENNLIDAVTNEGKENITVELNGKEYELEPQGYVDLNEDGSMRIYRKNSENFVWDLGNGTIYESIDGEERFVNEDGSISYPVKDEGQDR